MIKRDTNGIKIGTMLITSYFYRYNTVSSVVKIGTGVIKIGTYLGGPDGAKAKNRHFSRAFLEGSGLRLLGCSSCRTLANPNPCSTHSPG